MQDRCKALAKKYYPTILGHREHLHRHPELSFEEHATSAYIASTLDAIGLSYRTGLGGGTGITAELGSGDKLIAVRADIDALPIQEEGDHSYRSKHDGIMHACGHDVHTSCLLGAAYILKELEDELLCRVRLIFQPGEEKLPGGASLMIEDGVLEDVSAIIGQHVHPDLPVGQIGWGSGYFMASADEIYITVRGKGGHAAMPEQNIDPILISAEIVQSMQSLVSRRSPPDIPCVLSIGKINSVGGATNITPDEVKLEGTFRTYDEQWRFKAHDLLNRLVTSIANAHGAEAEVNILTGYPCLYNDPQLTKIIKGGIEVYAGNENTVKISPRMTAEDFAWYSQKVPACFYRLGTSSADGSNQSPVHTPTFDIDPDALRVGSGFLAYMTLKLASIQ